MIDQIKELRVQIDGYAQLTKDLKPIKGLNTVIVTEEGLKEYFKVKNSKEIEKAVDSLYLAKAWLGKLLGELGTTNPYGSGYKTKEDIVPTQDVAKEIKFPYKKYYRDENNLWFDKDKNLVGIEAFINGGIYGQYLKDGSFEEREDIISVDLNHIEKVDWLRQQFNILHMEVTSKLNQLVYKDKGDGELQEIRSHIRQHLSESRFWLGFECERIKNEK